VRRHVTVLAVTATRLIAGHTDEYGADDPMAPCAGSPDAAVASKAYATTSTETVPLDRITSVVVSRVVEDPASHKPGTPPREVVLTIGWGVVSRLDLEPANCGDPHCDADHGYTGTATADDVMIRVSAEADGVDAVTETLAFARALADATTRAGSADVVTGPGEAAATRTSWTARATRTSSCRSTAPGRSAICFPRSSRRWASRRRPTRWP